MPRACRGRIEQNMVNFKQASIEKFENNQKAQAEYNARVEIKNVADLGIIENLGRIDIETRTFGKGSEKEFDVTGFLSEDGKTFYRVPNSVLATIGELLEDDDTLEAVKIKKSGKGMATKYTVIPA